MTDLRTLHAEAVQHAAGASRYGAGLRLDALAAFANVVVEILGELLPETPPAPEPPLADDVAYNLANTPAPEPFDPATAAPLAVLAHPGRSGRPAEVWVHADPGDTAPWMRHHLTPFGAGYDWRYTTEVPTDAVPLVPAPAPFVRGVDELSDDELTEIWRDLYGYEVRIEIDQQRLDNMRRLYDAIAGRLQVGTARTTGGTR